MKKVVVASDNPVKVEVAKRAFAGVYPGEAFEFVALKSYSGVPEQPMGEETKIGAYNRLNFVRERHPEADFWISQEGGLFEEGESLYNRAWVAVCDKEGFQTDSSTCLFYLPKQVSAYIREGLELGDANDKFFGTKNIKHGLGGSGVLTDGLIDRTNYYLQAAIFALSQLKKKEWYR